MEAQALVRLARDCGWPLPKTCEARVVDWVMMKRLGDATQEREGGLNDDDPKFPEKLYIFFLAQKVVRGKDKWEGGQREQRGCEL